MSNRNRHNFARPLALALTLSAIGASCANNSTGPAGGPSSTSTQTASIATNTGAQNATPTTSATTAAPAKPLTDIIATSKGDLLITPVRHATLVLQHGGKTIHVDPWSQGNLDGLPKADLILLTDVHFDHLDKAAIEKVKKANTVIVGPAAVASELPGTTILKNGESKVFLDIPIEAIPMYNKTRGPSVGKLFHDKGRGNGYVLTFGATRVYLSGDTECTDEMRALRDIDVAFVCMNLPYTMPPAEAAECVKAFRPKILYPYHYRDSKLEELTGALAGEKGIDIRLRNWY